MDLLCRNDFRILNRDWLSRHRLLLVLRILLDVAVLLRVMLLVVLRILDHDCNWHILNLRCFCFICKFQFWSLDRFRLCQLLLLAQILFGLPFTRDMNVSGRISAVLYQEPLIIVAKLVAK